MPLTMYDVKTMVNNKIQNQWQIQWNQENSDGFALITKEFIKKMDINKLKEVGNMSYKDIGILFQAISGHGLFGHHLKK